MDLTTILGVVIGMVMIVFLGIGPSKLGNFWDPNSLAIVLGGTIAAVIASFPFKVLKRIPSHAKIILGGKKNNIPALLDTLEEMATTARKNGLLSLEQMAQEQPDAFFKQGILLLVDAIDPEAIRGMMENELDTMAARHDESAGLYEKAAAYAPAFGMIGTLVGLINMLKEMDLSGEGGADSIGPNMGVALITTFYGCIFANLFFMPMAKKLRIRDEEEYLYRQIMIEGILSIQAGDNPKFLREKLMTYIAEKDRKKMGGGGDDGDGGGKGKKEKKGKK